jgi:RimJ/RimL family protein N-acetyltransferase
VDFTGFAGQTERMLLRAWTESDLPEFFDLYHREEVCRYLPWEPRDQEACLDAIGRHQSLRLECDDDHVAVAAFDAASGRLAGELTLFLRSAEHKGGEVGYAIHPDFWRQGRAIEGAAAMLQLGFDAVGMHRVIARLDAHNTGSARVLERLGMRREAHLVKNEWFKGEWGDELDYAMLDEEWGLRPHRSLVSWHAGPDHAVPAEDAPG